MYREYEPTTCEHCGKVIGYGDEAYHDNGLDFCSFDCWAQDAKPTIGDLLDWVMSDEDLKIMFFEWCTEKEETT